MKFRKQYIASDRPIEGLEDDFLEEKIGALRVYRHGELDCFRAEAKIKAAGAAGGSGRIELLALGFMIDPRRPEAENDEILKGLAAEAADGSGGYQGFSRLMEALQEISGRYAVFYEGSDGRYVINDACALRSVYYTRDGRLFICSAERLFLEVIGGDLQIAPEKRRYIESRAFEWDEHSWMGDDGHDDRLGKLTPNHYLDIGRRTVERTPLFFPDLKNDGEVISYVKVRLEGSLDAACRRWKPMIGVTAGTDTRLLVAASKKFARDIQFYTFAGRPDADSPDIYISRELSGRLGIDWELLVTEPLREDFLRVYEAEHTFPRRLPKTRRIQYLYDHHRDDGSLVINGNCTEIARTNYGTVKFSTPGAMADVIGYPWQPYVLRKCREWLDDTEDFVRQYGIPRADLIYWEMRMGNWHALHAHEQDIAAEEFSPFNHKGIILALLSVDVRRRLPPDYPFFHDLIAAMWPECLDVEINPDNTLKKKLVHEFITFFKRRPRPLYWMYRLRKFAPFKLW